MRFAQRQIDFWELESGEDRHSNFGKRFEIPSEEERRQLTKGDLAKLLFELEADNDGELEVFVERMWVLVTHVAPEYFVGRLVNEPACLNPDGAQIRIGDELPFRKEHVIAIHRWSDKDAQEFISRAPFRPWPRCAT